MTHTLTLAQAREHLQFCGSFDRLPTLCSIAPLLEWSDFLTVLGEEWQGCDNIAAYTNVDGELWDTPFSELVFAPLEYRSWMMTPEERSALEALPEIVTVYRGCYANNKRGFSWSLSRSVAEKSPTLHRYSQPGQPLLIRGEVSRDKILALKIGRDEFEVIADRPKIRSISHIRVSGPNPGRTGRLVGEHQPTLPHQQTEC